MVLDGCPVHKAVSPCLGGSCANPRRQVREHRARLCSKTVARHWVGRHESSWGEVLVSGSPQSCIPPSGNPTAFGRYSERAHRWRRLHGSILEGRRSNRLTVRKVLAQTRAAIASGSDREPGASPTTQSSPYPPLRRSSLNSRPRLLRLMNSRNLMPFSKTRRKSSPRTPT
jgi:hypothetical protein